MTISRTITAATEREHGALLSNLFNLYLHDMAPYFAGIDIGPDGRYQYDYAWEDSLNVPYLMFADGLPAGFALLRRGSVIDDDPDVWDMSEFFVLRSQRRHGTGAWLARAAWSQHPGIWDIRIGAANSPALAFWPAAIRAHIGDCPAGVMHEEGGSRMLWYRFDSRAL